MNLLKAYRGFFIQKIIIFIKEEIEKEGNYIPVGTKPSIFERIDLKIVRKV